MSRRVKDHVPTKRVKLRSGRQSSQSSAPLVPDKPATDDTYDLLAADAVLEHSHGSSRRRGADGFKGRRKRASFAVFVDFWLDARSPVSLWRQLHQQLRQAIISARLPPGMRLPATRLLAEELGCSRNTVLGAFEQLIAEGYLEGRIGSGTYVADMLPDDVTMPVGLGLARSKAACALELSRRGHLATLAIPPGREPYKAFAPGLPDVSLFPFETWEKVARIWHSPSRSLLTQADPRGYGPLRETICDYLRTSRMIECRPEDVIITTGAQNGIDMAARLLLDLQEPVWVEDPSYPGLRSVLSAADAFVVPVPVDAEGLSLTEGAKTGTRPRMIVVSPSHQYPLGVTMSLQRRLELLTFADQSDCWIIETDYENEFRYSGHPPAALRSLDGGERVVYVGTFSKVLFPSLRIGYLIVPSRIADRFSLARIGFDLLPEPPILPQPIVDTFIREGFFSAHVRRMRSIYRNRQAALIEAAEKHLSKIMTVRPNTAGMHLLGYFTPEVSERLTDDEASQRTAACGVIAPPLSSFYADRRSSNALVLGYTAVDERALASAAQKVAQVLCA
ncbi:MAG: PLP-dependent aminotransferase family protein [Hyphomicrobiales bacterium]|nr:PLP-dependent aminotransferase family protein [Hyphomicrobiales bacterium]